jgi:addiction module HigA family antidote
MAKDKSIVEPQVELQKLVEKYQLSVAQFSEDIGLSQSGARQILNGKSRITVPIGLKLAKYFNSRTEDYWINIQAQYDIAEAKKNPEISDALKSIKPAKIPEKKPVASKTPAKAKVPAKPKKDPVVNAKTSKSTTVKAKSAK